MKDNPNSLALKAIGGNELLEGADQASAAAYEVARNLGHSDDAAHGVSQKVWGDYLQKWRPTPIIAPGVPGGQLPRGEMFPKVIGQPGANQLGATEGAPGMGGKGGTLPLPGAPGQGGGQSGSTLPLQPPAPSPGGGNAQPPNANPCPEGPCGSPLAKSIGGMSAVQELGKKP